jgi:hypothetical protein
MASKRKFVPEDDHTPSNDNSSRAPRPKRARREVPQEPPKRTRSARQQTTQVPLKHTRSRRQEQLDDSAEESDHEDSTPKSSKPTKVQTSGEKKATKLAAELANLADYNAPPEPRPHQELESDADSDDEGSVPFTKRQSRRALATKKHPVKDSRVTKSKPQLRTKPLKKQSKEERLATDVAELEPWHGSQSRQDDNADESEDDNGDNNDPKSYTVLYPSAQLGVQNQPWSSLPGEIRNTIYEYCMINEEEKKVNVKHYPDGIPRRSSRGDIPRTNFPHSHWGFTQTCQQVRDEFTSWLLQKRRVRTSFTTLNDYVETFHRPNPRGEIFGWIEPICTGAALPGDGVEILNLINYKKANPGFHLELTPTTPSTYQELFATEGGFEIFDELTLMQVIDEHFATGGGPSADVLGIEAINIRSLSMEEEMEVADGDDDDDDDDDDSHEILIKLEMTKTLHYNWVPCHQLRALNRLLFVTELSSKDRLKVRASFAGLVAEWLVREPGEVLLRCIEARRGGKKTFARLTDSHDGVGGFREEEL